MVSNYFIKNLLLSFLLFSIHLLAAQPSTISRQTEISILTCGPSNEVYTVFGHTAVRVSDPLIGIDNVYNYGSFDFDTPNFYIKFITGKLNYRLSKNTFHNFITSYKITNRLVIEQVLDLDYEQKQKLYAYLEQNYLPGNRNYLYDYFKNNCSTKVRDAINDTIENVAFRKTNKESKTFRKLLYHYIGEKPWLKFSINLLLGLPADHLTNAYEYMFLPDNLKEGLDKALKQNKKPLVKKTDVLVSPLKTNADPPSFRPAIAFTILFIFSFILSIYDLMRKKTSKWFDFVYFGILGITGYFLLFLWIVSDHESMGKNMNLLWANPLYLLSLLFLGKNKSQKWSSYLFLLYFFLGVFLLAGWNMIPQELDVAVVPLLGIIMLRSAFYLIKRQKLRE